MMTQQLANQLIADYTEIISRISGMEDLDKIKTFLFINRATDGICDYARVRYNTNINQDDWVVKYDKYGGYWDVRPIRCGTKPEIIRALQVRVDILKTFK